MAAWHGRAKAEQPGAPPARLLRSAKGVSTVNRRGQRHLKGETKLLFWIHLVALTAKLRAFGDGRRGMNKSWREKKAQMRIRWPTNITTNQALETPSASNDDSDSPLLTPGLHNFTKAIMKCDIFKNLRWSKLQGMIDSAFLNNLIDKCLHQFPNPSYEEAREIGLPIYRGKFYPYCFSYASCAAFAAAFPLPEFLPSW